MHICMDVTHAMQGMPAQMCDGMEQQQRGQCSKVLVGMAAAPCYGKLLSEVLGC